MSDETERLDERAPTTTFVPTLHTDGAAPDSLCDDAVADLVPLRIVEAMGLCVVPADQLDQLFRSLVGVPGR